MPTLLNPRLGAHPIGYSIPLHDLLEEGFEPVPVVGHDTAVDRSWAVEQMRRCVEIVSGARPAPRVDASVHRRVLASLRRDAGMRPELRGPQVVAVRFQAEPAVTRLAMAMTCGDRVVGVTGDFRRNARGGHQLTHFGVL